MNRRLDRVNSELQKYIYKILTTKYKDPFMTEIFSISNVDVSPDLKFAKVYVSILSTTEEKKQKTFEAITRSGKYVKHELSQISHLRTVPEISYILDDSIDIDNHINQILSKITYSQQDDKKE